MPALRPPDHWETNFLARSPAFFTYQKLIKQLPEDRFPSLLELNQLSPDIAHPHNTKGIQFVAQDYQPRDFWARYEPRIFARGEVQTRTENWHDYFHALVWKTFPHAKLALNGRHLHEQGDTQEKHRNTTQQALTQFDECGALLISDNKYWIERLRQHDWHTLFVTQRTAWDKHLRVILFGHATLEQLLHPFIGLTAKVLPCVVEASQLHAPLTFFDDWLATQLADLHQWQHPRDLLPLPLLGIPGWYAENIDPLFYQNTQYFRPARFSTN